MCDLNKSLTTKTLHAELVFNLSGSRNVAESFRRFGISDESTSLLVCAFDADSEKLTSLKTLAVGKMTSINELAQDADVKLIKKYYKIQEPELSFSSLLDAIVCRIATKSCLK
jgi:EKC/KEOPS complex subunit CGI121/TPRKB